MAPEFPKSHCFLIKTSRWKWRGLFNTGDLIHVASSATQCAQSSSGLARHLPSGKRGPRAGFLGIDGSVQFVDNSPRLWDQQHCFTSQERCVCTKQQVELCESWCLVSTWWGCRGTCSFQDPRSKSLKAGISCVCWCWLSVTFQR